MYRQPLRDLWEAGGQTAPCGNASSRRVHGQCGQGSAQLDGCPAGPPGTRARKSDPVGRQKLHAMFTAWGCVIERDWREAMASGARPALDPGTTAQTVVVSFEGVMM